MKNIFIKKRKPIEDLCNKLMMALYESTAPKTQDELRTIVNAKGIIYSAGDVEITMKELERIKVIDKKNNYERRNVLGN